MHKSEFVVVYNSSIERSHRSARLAIAGQLVVQRSNVQLKSLSDIVDPRDALKSDRVFFAFADPSSFHILLKALLEDEGIGDLDRGWIWTYPRHCAVRGCLLRGLLRR
jgi:hypothetical protein